MPDASVPLKCLVVDDEPLAQALLSDYIRKTPGLELVAAVSDPLLGLEWVRRMPPDLVFLDMHMPELDGVQFLQILQQRCLVIVTTAYSEYALAGYEHHVVDYLLKPITLERFLIATHKAQRRGQAHQPVPVVAGAAPESPFIFIRTEYKILKLNLSDIYYLEGARDYVVIHTTTEKVLTLQSLRSLEAQLPAEQFARIHKSYVVAFARIAFIERNRVSIRQQLLPISETYREAFFKRLNLGA
ncbi:LytR/AlgR family response regulator transcription factor [Hymenobacter fodinae]|uniref:Response regulator transcription factor n=1 Tax=Hymenobacter fodinae TaxID=2510796 RepID=A0A4Z0P1L2_9BACT|nr:LytTR family DNA-binding domain-containing protein [Hymenobacter fodinae]TGE03725.1 response regulator transcription factor [Hymenobacter fodinae]